jgi:hypothetical protein
MTQVMTSNDGQKQIRGNPGHSSYFQGGYRAYGQYQWNCKYYDFGVEGEEGSWENEIDDARRFFFGEYTQDKKGRKCGYDALPFIIGRKPLEEGGTLIDSGFSGRSGGWFVVDEELTDEELEKLDKYIQEMMDTGLKQFLEEERAVRRQEKADAEAEERERRRQVLGDQRLQRIAAQLRKIAGEDFSLIVHGVDVVKTLEETLTDPEKTL